MCHPEPLSDLPPALPGLVRAKQGLGENPQSLGKVNSVPDRKDSNDLKKCTGESIDEPPA